MTPTSNKHGKGVVELDVNAEQSLLVWMLKLEKKPLKLMRLFLALATPNNVLQNAERFEYIMCSESFSTEAIDL